MAREACYPKQNRSMIRRQEKGQLRFNSCRTKDSSSNGGPNLTSWLMFSSMGRSSRWYRIPVIRNGIGP
ncbi:hypothetical protein JTE90_004997 [Oedothorax gibbosus]|uniref:Uncharacterized protein n=1 Tax=Oedothorax gibbosus TaxID=931172 RepID=A0AAV6VCD6_9ARAC|nr:hypothetical protein JTE90_004997 [Oedothorax gibbosus]